MTNKYTCHEKHCVRTNIFVMSINLFISYLDYNFVIDKKKHSQISEYIEYFEAMLVENK